MSFTFLAQRTAQSLYAEVGRCAASTWLIPCLIWKLKPWYLNGLLLLIKTVPFIPPGPYSAEDAPGNNSILSTSNSLKPITLPTEKLRPGAWLSIPSTNWFKRVLPLLLNPRVPTDLKVKLAVTTSTPFKLVRMS